MNEPSATVQHVIGGMMGDSAAREGVTEAARRLSHALAEIVNVLEPGRDVYEDGANMHKAIEKATGTLKEWGVA